MATKAHAALKWDERLAKLSGEEGIVVQQDKARQSLAHAAFRALQNASKNIGPPSNILQTVSDCC